MKNFLLMLALGLGFLPGLRSATLTVSNYGSGDLSIHGVTDSTGTRLGGDTTAFVVLGRMTVDDTAVAQMVADADTIGLYQAFVPFASARNPFALNTTDEYGYLAAVFSASTKPSASEFGGESIYVWIYKGASRLSATNVLLARLNVDFPEDDEIEPEENELVYLRPDTATFLLGSSTGTPHDYQLGGGAQASLQMAEQVPVSLNNAPIAQDGTLAVTRGQSASGTLLAEDEDGEDILTFGVVADPTKGSVQINPNGTYTYTSTAGFSGDDSFTFHAYDGEDYSAAATVTVTISDLPPGSVAPSIVLDDLPSGYVGSYYEFAIPVANLPQGLPSSFVIKGLPGGLKLDKNTGIIAGYPTAAFTNKTVTLSAKNSGGDSGNVLASITINPVPEAIVGNYLANIERSDSMASGLGGRLNLTITSKGAFTAKLQAGAIAYSAKGRTEIVDGDEDVEVRISDLQFVRNGQPTLVANLTLDPATPAASAFQLTGTLTGADSVPADVTGVRNTWTKISKPVEYTGGYTYGLTVPEDLETEEEIPQGYGFGALTVTDKGTATFVGRTADGKSFTVPTILGPQGHLPLYSIPAVKTSSLVGTPRIELPEAFSETDFNSITGFVSWEKPAVDSKSKDRAYREGFEAFDLALVGGLYVPPAPGGVVGGLADNGTTDTQANTWLTFTGGGLLEADMAPLPFTIMNKKDTGIKQTVILPKPTPKTPDTDPNPNSVTFKLLAKPAGYFSGTFTLPNAVKSLVRKTVYQGTLVRFPDGTYDRMGFFLLAELPIGSEKPNTTPQQSGWVEILAQDPDVN